MKFSFRIFTLCISFFVFSVLSSDAKDWNGITPVKSTYADVVKILGAPKKPLWSEYEYFELNGDKLYFAWVDPTCARQNPLPRGENHKADDIAWNFSVFPKTPLSFDDKNYSFRELFSLICSGRFGNGQSCFYYDPLKGFSFTTVDEKITKMVFSATKDTSDNWGANHKNCFKTDNQND